MDKYIDRALTATTDKHPAFLKMIEDSKKKSFDIILVYQLDRFARNRIDSAIYKSQLKKNGVKVVSAKESITEDASGVLMESLLEGMAEYYSRELSQKVRRGIRESLIKGHYIGGYVSYGYDVVDKKFVINPEESKIIKKIFTDYAGGKKVKEITDELKEMRIKTKTGKFFTINGIARIIRNQRYIGIYENDGKIYDNIFPAIIDETTFKRCNNLMNDHKHRQRKELDSDDIYILSGKLY